MLAIKVIIGILIILCPIVVVSIMEYANEKPLQKKYGIGLEVNVEVSEPTYGNPFTTTQRATHVEIAENGLTKMLDKLFDKAMEDICLTMQVRKEQAERIKQDDIYQMEVCERAKKKMSKKESGANEVF